MTGMSRTIKIKGCQGNRGQRSRKGQGGKVCLADPRTYKSEVKGHILLISVFSISSRRNIELTWMTWGFHRGYENVTFYQNMWLPRKVNGQNSLG